MWTDTTDLVDPARYESAADPLGPVAFRRARPAIKHNSEPIKMINQKHASSLALAALATTLFSGSADAQVVPTDVSTTRLELYRPGKRPASARGFTAFGEGTFQPIRSPFFLYDAYVREIRVPFADQVPDSSTPGQGACAYGMVALPCDWSEILRSPPANRFAVFQPGNPERLIRWPNLAESYGFEIKLNAEVQRGFSLMSIFAAPPNSTRVVAHLPGLFTPLQSGLVRGTVAFGVLNTRRFVNRCENLSVVGVLQTSEDGVTWTDVQSVSQPIPNADDDHVTNDLYTDLLEVSHSFPTATMVQFEVRLVRGAEVSPPADLTLPLHLVGLSGCDQDAALFLTEVRLAGEECVPDASDPSRCL